MGNWLIKYSSGKISGPHAEAEILRRISIGEIDGSERIAEYPGGDWQSISASRFSDAILDELGKAPKVNEKSDSRKDDLEQTRTGIDPKFIANTVKVESETKTRKSGGGGASAQNNSEPPVVELYEKSILSASEKKRSVLLPLVLIFLAILMVFLAIYTRPKRVGDAARLLLPRTGQPSLSEAKLKSGIDRAIAAFNRDTLQDYVTAQDEIVRVIEGSSKDIVAYSVLCLTYRELWPYAAQDSEDYRVLSTVVQRAKKIDPVSEYSGVCDVVEAALRGKWESAEALTETWLQQRALPAFYEIRGEIAFNHHEFELARRYYQSTQSVEGQWLKPMVQEARSATELQLFSEAYEIYKKVLQKNPKHGVSLIELGILESLQFRQEQKAIDLIQSAFSLPGKIPRDVLSRGHLELARIYERQELIKEAKRHAVLAYSLNQANLEARQILSRLGGSSEITPGKQNAQELMALGEQYFRSGDYLSALSQFRTVYEQDPKNGSAAMKAGQCLWQLNQSQEAINWLNRAILADRKLVVAYVELSNYYSQRYDFKSAIGALRKIESLNAKSYEVYRGFALVELRRNNFKGAIDYGSRALRLYESDLESALLLGKAFIGLNDYVSADRLANRSLELDQNSTEAQILKAQAILGLRGSDAGLAKLKRLTEDYPRIVAYKLALGEMLMKEERFSEAEAAFSEVIAHEPKNKKALLAKGKAILSQKERLIEALQSFLAAASMDPSDAEALFHVGLVYFEQNQWAKTMDQMKKVSESNPRYPRAHYFAGKAAIQKGEPKVALEEAFFERGINPDLPEAYSLAAEANFYLKNYTECASQYQKAVSLSPQVDFFVRMARCYRKSGALESAVSVLRQAAVKESGNAQIFKEQGAIFQLQGNASAAVASYETYLRLAPNAKDKATIQNQIARIESGNLDLPEEEPNE